MRGSSKLMTWLLARIEATQSDRMARSRAEITVEFFLFQFVYSIVFAAFLHFFEAEHEAAVMLFSSLGLASALTYIRWRGAIKCASLIYFFTNYVSTSLMMLLSPGETSVLHGVWYILLISYVYLNLGLRWAWICFALIAATFHPIALLKFKGFNAWADPDFPSQAHHIATLLTLTVAFALIFYILRRFIDLRMQAERSLSEANQILQARKQELRHSQEQMQAMLAAIPDRIVRISREGRILFAKAEPGQLIIECERLLGMNLSEMPITDSVKNQLLEGIQTAIATGTPQMVEYEVEHPRLGNIILEARIVKSGEEEALMIVRDITERIQTERALAESRHFTDRIMAVFPNIFWVFDHERQQMLMINEQHFGSLGLGYSKEYIISLGGRIFEELIHPEDYPRVRAHIQEIIDTLPDGQVAQMDYRMKAASGDYIWLHTRRAVFGRNAEGKGTKIIQVGANITPLKKAETELRQALHEARQASEAKAQFLSTMSHEIRTPLNAVIGFSNLLLMEEPKDEQRDGLAAINSSANHLHALISDILDFSKIEAGMIEFESTPFDLGALLRDTLAVFRHQAQRKNITLGIGALPALPHQLLGDPVRLRQVLFNLTGNALKFTPEGGNVRLHCQPVAVSETEVRLEFAVQDSGIGIPADKVASIFESFTQASSDTTRRYGGTGLGLAICKNLIEMQGGLIWLESREGLGSTFRFLISYEKGAYVAPQEASLSKPTADVSLQGMRVLLAEDNMLNTMVATKLLSKWGIEVTAVGNGQEAVSRLLESDYDLVLMDLHMPVLDGFQAVAQIRALSDEAKRTVPIIALSASVSTESQDRVQLNSMDGFVTKPFKPEDLLKTLVKYKGIKN